MTQRRAFWVAALLGCAVLTVQAQTSTAPAETSQSAKEVVKESAKDAGPARNADPEPRRRLKFKGRAGNCLCADPITEEEIDAAAARQTEASTKTQTPRSQP